MDKYFFTNYKDKLDSLTNVYRRDVMYDYIDF